MLVCPVPPEELDYYFTSSELRAMLAVKGEKLAEFRRILARSRIHRIRYLYLQPGGAHTGRSPEVALHILDFAKASEDLGWKLTKELAEEALQAKRGGFTLEGDSRLTGDGSGGR